MRGRTMAVLTAAGLAAAGCGEQAEVRAICDAAPRAERAIYEAELPPEMTNELLDDVAEYAADTGHCRAFEGQGEEEGE